MCRIYFDREEYRKKLPPELNNCPVECPNSSRYFDANRTKQCETCPYKLERENLINEAENLIYDTLGKLDAKFPVKNVLGTIYQIGALKELSPEKMSVKTAEMVEIYQSEKYRVEAIREAEKKLYT